MTMVTKLQDPVAEMKLRAATAEESAAARGGYLWRVMRLPWDVTRKVMGIAKLFLVGADGTKWERPELQAWVDRACHLVGLRPEEKFMQTFHTGLLGNLHRLSGSRRSLRALLAHHRNEDLFANNLSMHKLFQFCELIFPEEQLTLDDFMLTCSPEFTRTYRTLLHSVLKQTNLKEFLPNVYATAQRTVADWGKRSAEGEIINASEETRLLTSSLIAQLMFDSESSSKEIAQAIDFMNLFILKTLLKTVTEGDKTKFQEACIIFRNAVNAVLTRCTPLFAHVQGLSSAQKKVLIFTLYFAGQETTSALLVWIIRQLALSPATQDDLRKKLREVNSLELPERQVKQSEILKALFNREIAQFPPAFSTGRKLAKDVCIEYRLDGESATRKLVVFKGEIIAASVMKHAEMELARGTDDLDHHDWVPFGSGPHRCPGEEFAKLEMFVILAELLLNHKISLANARPVHKVGLFTLKLSADIEIKLEAV